MNKLSVLAALAATVGIVGCASADSGSGKESSGKRGHAERGERSEGRQGMRMDKDGLPRDLAELNLSDAQKTKIKAIMEANRPSDAAKPQPAREQMNPAEFNEAKARQMIAERQQQHAEMELKRMKMQHEIYKVLTPEQQKQWQENQKRRQAGRPGMGQPPVEGQNPAAQAAK